MAAPPLSVDLEIRLLGALEVRRQGARVALPRSKKTRALLAYLAITGHEHSRDRLCSLLWEATDDPRGALRWSLSKLRGVIEGDGVDRIEADRRRVALVTGTVRVDVGELMAVVEGGVGVAPCERLEEVAASARGELLEGLDLPDLFELQAWCIAQRERAREALCKVYAELVRRWSSEPLRALTHAVAWVSADGYGVTARAKLLELLLQAGKPDEARRQYEVGRRLLREVGGDVASLDQIWRELRAVPSASPETSVQAGAPPAVPMAPSRRSVEAERFVGRARELGRLQSWLEEARGQGCCRIVLMRGEPGAGKSRLADRFVALAAADGLVRRGRSYEAESSRPFGPWSDALGAEMHWPARERTADAVPTTREALFAAAGHAVAGLCRARGGALLILDDIQWLDRDSAELLHFLVRSSTRLPLLLVLLARTGELDDNEPVMRALRGIRRAGRVETLELPPLTVAEVGELVAGFEGVGAGDVEGIQHASAGNPLYALELARAGRSGSAASSSLVDLVRERVDRLPSEAAEVLRWGAVLGHVIDVALLRSLSTLEPTELVGALERLEQHALVQGEGDDGPGRYVFAHDVVREAVYAALSQPRRRLMHHQVARVLEPRMAEPEMAKDVAHHARLGGDASLAVRACVAAGLRSLRLLANGDAETLARRGIELAAELERPERIAATLELLHVQYSARTPDREEAATRVRELALEALDLGLTRPARLGFQMLSFLRWESSSMADAHENILQAERVSRSAESAERAVALAHAARCLVLLERNLSQAEAFLLEVEALAQRGGEVTSEVHFASAMLHEHRGELDTAAKAFRDARWRAREQGDRLAEFRAIEHWTMLEIDRGRVEEASRLASELATLGERVREGAEGPSARALVGLARRLAGARDQGREIEAALQELRRMDAKYPVAFVRTRLARIECAAGDWTAATAHARDGLEHAEAIGRRSEIALARVVLLRCAEVAGDSETAATHRDALTGLSRAPLSALALRALDEVSG